MVKRLIIAISLLLCSSNLWAQVPQPVTIFASAARTTTTNGSDVDAHQYRGIILYLNISAASGTTPTLDIKVQEKDPLTGNYLDIQNASFAQKTTTGTDYIALHPSLTQVSNRNINAYLVRTFRVVATIGGTTPSFTFSIYGYLLP